MLAITSVFCIAGCIIVGAALPSLEQVASDINERAALLDQYRLDTRAEYTILARASQQNKVKREDMVVNYQDFIRIATQQLQEIVSEATFRLIDDYYVGVNGIAHINFRQTIDGIDVDDAHFNVHILQDGTVLSFGNTFHSVEHILKVAKRINVAVKPLEAFQSAVKLLKLPVQGAETATINSSSEEYVVEGIEGVLDHPTVKLTYIRKYGVLTLAWRVETHIGSNLLSIYIGAVSGKKVVGVIDHTHAATYNAYPWGLLNPTEGSRELLVDPEDTIASPLGWHQDGAQAYTSARGNNLIPEAGASAIPSNPSLIFSYPYSPATVDYRSYLDASVTQGFYILNKFHDILYALGFDEPAGNFQVTNHGKGGLGNDPVRLAVQTGLSGGGYITTPVDGSSPRLVMYVYSGSPPRDAIFDATILLHEYMHAVSGRLAGGPGTAGCFSGNDGLSLTEGFSDLVPTLLRIKEDDTRDTGYTIADWATNTPLGLRSHFISTSEETSPLSFATLNQLTGGGFDLATIWAIPFYEIFWNLVDAGHSIGDVSNVTFGANGVPEGARYLLLKLILDSQALTPCRAHHLQARDALVQADEILTGGENRCAIWRGFAKRGFGTNAVRGSGATSRINGFLVPSGC